MLTRQWLHITISEIIQVNGYISPIQRLTRSMVTYHQFRDYPGQWLHITISEVNQASGYMPPIQVNQANGYISPFQRLTRPVVTCHQFRG